MSNAHSPLPIKHWSHSSLVTFLRNPLAWYKRYVEGVYDIPASPSSVVGRAAHVALQNFYGGIGKDGAIQLGLEYLRNVSDFEIHFGKARSARAKKLKRQLMEREYLQAVSFYLERPPRHNVLGVEVKGTAEVEGLPLPLKAVSDLVVRSKRDRQAIDIVDHKFVDAFSMLRKEKPLFVIQAIFNYYVVRELYKKPVHRFILYECKKRKNSDGSSQVRRYVIEYAECKEDFALFHRLITDATAEISRPRTYLPNPSDMFEGDDSFNLYRLGLTSD
ncbi:PD-(D/E)XK nuclease family protein [Candidatus Kaiserbacteria bacterium]|nr:PD-(D/E)XK nuclease family protein [Candidatus Kaiserbacteria bacterium]